MLWWGKQWCGHKVLWLANKCFLYYQESAEEVFRLWGFLQTDVKEILHLDGKVGGMSVRVSWPGTLYKWVFSKTK